MSGKPSTPNPFAKKKEARIIDEVIPDRRTAAPLVVAPKNEGEKAAAPSHQKAKQKPTRTGTTAPGRFRTTFDVERKAYRRVQNFAADLYDFNGGNVTAREVMEAAIKFAFENEASFEAFMKAQLSADKEP